MTRSFTYRASFFKETLKFSLAFFFDRYFSIEEKPPEGLNLYTSSILRDTKTKKKKGKRKTPPMTYLSQNPSELEYSPMSTKNQNYPSANSSISSRKGVLPGYPPFDKRKAYKALRSELSNFVFQPSNISHFSPSI